MLQNLTSALPHQLHANTQSFTLPIHTKEENHHCPDRASAEDSRWQGKRVALAMFNSTGARQGGSAWDKKREGWIGMDLEGFWLLFAGDKSCPVLAMGFHDSRSRPRGLFEEERSGCCLCFQLLKPHLSSGATPIREKRETKGVDWFPGHAALAQQPVWLTATLRQWLLLC